VARRRAYRPRGGRRHDLRSQDANKTGRRVRPIPSVPLRRGGQKSQSHAVVAMKRPAADEARRGIPEAPGGPARGSGDLGAAPRSRSLTPLWLPAPFRADLPGE